MPRPRLQHHKVVGVDGAVGQGLAVVHNAASQDCECDWFEVRVGEDVRALLDAAWRICECPHSPATHLRYRPAPTCTKGLPPCRCAPPSTAAYAGAAPSAAPLPLAALLLPMLVASRL